MFHRVSAAAVLIAMLEMSGQPASAQETRTGLLEQQRAAKAASLEPYKPGKLETLMLWYEEHELVKKLAPYNGFYLQYGFRWKPVGAGLGVGAGFRHDLFGRTARIQLGSGITFRNYQMLQADFSLPYLAGERVELGAYAVHRHNPQEDFWGLGPESVKGDRVSFTVSYEDFQARGIVRPTPWLEAAARYGRLKGAIGSGTDPRFPSIEERFSDPEAPGLLQQPDFSYVELTGGLDYRDQEDNARAGGYYAVSWRRYNDLDFDHYSFKEIDAQVQQFFPIFDKKRVFALQARLLSTTPDAGHEVPFYLKPTLGGSTTVRGYNDFRFRDDHVLFFNAEYRWEAFSGLDMAVFSDWGTLASQLKALSGSNLKKGYGIGFRFNTYKTVWLRLDIGFGGHEGIRYFFKFSKAF